MGAMEEDAEEEEVAGVMPVVKVEVKKAEMVAVAVTAVDYKEEVVGKVVLAGMVVRVEVVMPTAGMVARVVLVVVRVVRVVRAEEATLAVEMVRQGEVVVAKAGLVTRVAMVGAAAGMVAMVGGQVTVPTCRCRSSPA